MPIREERLRRIIEWVDQETSVSIAELTSRLNVSAMTVWRDLESLEQQGYIQRVRGGAMKTGSSLSIEPLFEMKQRVANEQKKHIARYAAQHFIHDNDVIILEGGTTVASMIPFLNKQNLTVMTNGLNILMRCSGHSPRMTVMCCGGIMREKSHTFVGPQAESYFTDFRADTFFICGTGLTPADGLTDPNLLEIQVKRAMKRASRQVVLLLDSTKFNQRSLAQIFPLNDIDVMITDQAAPPELLSEIRGFGVDIHVAGPAYLMEKMPIRN